MKRSLLVLFALLATGCVHTQPKPPAQPTPRPTPAPTALPSPTPTPAPAMPARVVAWFREGGAVDEGLCAQNPTLWNVTSCDHGYRQIAPLGNAHTTPDCMVNGTDTTLDDEITCEQQYVQAMENDYPGLPWVITIDERGRQADQYALYPWCKDRWCAVTGSDEWCDESASKANVKAQVDAYHAETVAAYGHPLPVIGVLGPQGITESWCDGWTEWDIVAPELYALPPTTPDQMENSWNQAVAMIPASQTVGACLQAYSRNGSIPDPQQMASYPARGWQVATKNPRTRFVIPFSGWRAFGTQYHRPILGPVAEWGSACYLAGTGCANPPIPPPAATPEPTPKPTPIVGPGSIVTPSVNNVFPAGTTTAAIGIARKDGTRGEIVLGYNVTCNSTGDDCTGANVAAGALTFPDGADGAVLSFAIPPQTQPGQRVWLVRLLSVSGGGQIDSGPGPSHCHVTVAASDPGVNFWVASGLVVPGNPWGIVLERGDCRQPAAGSWCLEPGSTLVEQTDYELSGVRCGSLGAHPAWSMDAGVCQFFASFGTAYTAISGHAGVLTILPDDPTRRVGKMKVAVQ